MSTTDRPAAVPAQPTTMWYHERGAAFWPAGCSGADSAACARDEDLAVAAAVAVDRDAFATELVGELIGALDVLWSGVAPEVDGLADGGVDVALEGGLHPDVGGDVDFVGGGEHALDVIGDVGAAADTAVLDDRGEQLVAGEALFGGDAVELRVDLGELGAVEDVAAIRERIEWLDAAGATGDDADRAGRRDRGGGGVAQRAVPGALPPRSGPGREGAAALGECSRGCQRLAFEERGDAIGERERGVGVVGDAEGGERVGPAHDAEADLAGRRGGALDLGQRIAIGIDDVVEEPHGGVDRGGEPRPVELAGCDEAAEVDRAKGARFEREQWLLAARVGCFDRAEAWGGMQLVDPVDEHAARVAAGPRGVGHRVEHAARVELAGGLAGAWVDQRVAGAVAHRGHERVGHGDRQVEVAHPRRVELDRDELEDVRVVDAQDAHVGAAARPALLDRLGRHVEHLHQRHGSRGGAAGGGDEVAGRAQPGEREAGAAARLLDLGGPAHRLEHAGRGVVDRDHEAGGELAEWPTGVHQSGRVGQELERRHHAFEGVACRGDLPGRVAHRGLGGTDVVGDATEQAVGGLDDDALLAHQVAGAEHRQGVVRQRRDHVRTVRSAAWRRNRPRGSLAWMILLILAALIALVARVDAAGAADEDAVDLAIRYADALTSLARDPARAPTLAAPNHDGEAQEDDEDDDADDGEASAVQRSDPEEDDDDETTQPDLAGDAPAVLDVDRAVDEENRAKSIHPTSIDDELTVTDILRARDEENGDLSIRPTSIDDELTASIDDQGDGGVGDADSGQIGR